MGDAYRLNELGYSLPAGPHLLPRATVESLDAAAGLLRAAEARAADLVAAAEQAYADRCAEGYAAGLAEAAREALRRLAEENAVLDAGLRACEADLARLVADCTRRLMADFDDQARAEAVVRDALRHMRREKRAELRVAPGQFAAFKASVEEIRSGFPDMELIDVVADPALAPPRVVLESRIGRVEADLDASLAAFEALMRAAASRFAEAGA